MFASDWNKDYWSFYAYVALEKHEHDLEFILQEMNKLNYRDGDTYVELIDRTESVNQFYRYLYDRGTYSHSEVLNKSYWEAREAKGDDHFRILRECYGAHYHQTAQEARDEENYSVFADFNEALEVYRPELYQALDKANALSCFNAEQYFNGESYTKLSDQRVAFTY